MNSTFSILDWSLFFVYFIILIITSIIFSKTEVKTSKEYFTSDRSISTIAVAISLLATSQSAATFLGGPEYSFNRDLTFLGFYLSAFLAILFVAKVLVPKFYEIDAVTVYGYLGVRYGTKAKIYAGVMFLIGRLFASGARLYIGALAISMILFSDIEPIHIIIFNYYFSIWCFSLIHIWGCKGRNTIGY